MGSVAGLDHSLNLGGRTQILGYVLIRVQVEGVSGYDEDQVAFVVDDPSTSFSVRVLIVLGTLTLNCIVAVMKESKMHKAPAE